MSGVLFSDGAAAKALIRHAARRQAPLNAAKYHTVSNSPKRRSAVGDVVSLHAPVIWSQELIENGHKHGFNHRGSAF